jgi:hypothetical protein
MPGEASMLRLYLMRLLFLLNFELLGLDTWPAIINHKGAWDPMHGVALSFWAAWSALSGLGLRYPLKMVPLLLLQFFYKSVWLIAVARSLRSAGQSTSLTETFVIGVVLDLIIIPWPYVAHYVRERGDRWRKVPRIDFSGWVTALEVLHRMGLGPSWPCGCDCP